MRRIDLAAEPASVREVRTFVRWLLGTWRLEELVDTVVLLASELATNAVLHARTSYAVVITRSDDEVRVDVLDGSAVSPQHRHNTRLAATGRGVALVDRLAGAWGATPANQLDGFVKGIWFTVPVAGAEENAWPGDLLDRP